MFAGLAALRELAESGDSRAKRAQAVLSLDTFNLLIGCSALDNASATLAAKLFALAAKNIASGGLGKESSTGSAAMVTDIRAYLINSLNALVGHGRNALTREMHEKLKTMVPL